MKISSKYAYSEGNALLTTQSFKDLHLDKDIVKTMVKAANRSVTRDTWSSYRTSLEINRKCSRDTELDLPLPSSTSVLLIYAGWLLQRRDLKEVSTFMSGLKKCHEALNLPFPKEKPEQLTSS